MGVYVAMTDPKNLTEVLDKVEEEVDSSRLSLGQIVDMFQHRGYGPLILTASMIVVLPTGGIPGVPTVIGLSILLIASQLVVGRSSPWLPQRLRKLSFKKAAFDKGAEKIKPITEKIDYVIRPRLMFLTHGIAARFVGLACVVIAALLPFTEFIPFSDVIPGFSLAFLALGLTARDGLCVIIGLLLAMTAIIGGLYLFIF